MKQITHPFIATAFLIMAACSSTKKSTTPAVSNVPAPATAPASTTPPVVPGPSFPARSSNGVYAPGNNELLAIQKKYSEVTMQTLTQGHAIYTGVCTNCHEAKSIYKRPEESWQGIIDDMAVRSQLTTAEKDAVYKYVLAIKGTQPNGPR